MVHQNEKSMFLDDEGGSSSLFPKRPDESHPLLRLIRCFPVVTVENYREITRQVLSCNFPDLESYGVSYKGFKYNQVCFGFLYNSFWFSSNLVPLTPFS